METTVPCKQKLKIHMNNINNKKVCILIIFIIFIAEKQLCSKFQLVQTVETKGRKYLFKKSSKNMKYSSV